MTAWAAARAAVAWRQESLVMQGLASFAAMPVEMSVESSWQGGVPFGVIQSFKCEE